MDQRKVPSKSENYSKFDKLLTSSNLEYVDCDKDWDYEDNGIGSDKRLPLVNEL